MDPQLKAELDEMNRLATQIRAEVAEMKKNFSVLDKRAKPTVEELVKQGHIWTKWYAWHPVKDIHGRWHWRKDVYRMVGNTYVDQENWLWYHYGTVFDVIRTTGNANSIS